MGETHAASETRRRPAPGQGGEFWTDRTVAWYERANAGSDYAARVLAAIEPHVVRCRTALDVGAGFGALTLPLARRLERVTALEPAPAMARALRAAARRERLDNVVVVEAAWGDAPVERHDLVFCAQVGALLRPGAAFLREAGAFARRSVAIVRDLGGDDKFFFRELYPLLLGCPYERTRDASRTIEDLVALGLDPDVTVIEYESDQPFDSLAEACDFWMTYMGLVSPGARAFLERFLGSRLARRGDGWIAPLHKRAAVIAWTADRGRR